ncbi:MAG: hypothetical protein Q3976_09925 [Corynebacterium sp.]|nr:hypothetical protein [Corynebacterium sp.]
MAKKNSPQEVQPASSNFQALGNSIGLATICTLPNLLRGLDSFWLTLIFASIQWLVFFGVMNYLLRLNYKDGIGLKTTKKSTLVFSYGVGILLVVLAHYLFQAVL